jgi:hypothetical protein
MSEEPCHPGHSWEEILTPDEMKGIRRLEAPGWRGAWWRLLWFLRHPLAR